MYGASVASLDVQLKGANGMSLTVWQLNGTQGDQWNKASIDIGSSGTSFANQVSILFEDD